MAQPVKMPQKPQVSDPALQQYLDGLHAVVESIYLSRTIPNPPTNLTVTPVAGGNVIQFTRSNAYSYGLFISPVRDRAQAVQVDLGSSNRYTDSIGSGAIVRFYWVVGLSQTGAMSSVTGPKSATSLGLGTPSIVSPIKVPAQSQVFDTTINRNRPVLPTTDPNVSGQPSEPVE